MSILEARPVVRPATPADVDEEMRLLQLLADSSRHETTPSTWVDSASTFLEKASDGESARVIVAEHPSEQGRLVAIGVGVIMQIQPTYWLANGRLGYLQSFYTEADWRGRGIGTEILLDLIKWFDGHHVRHVNLYATTKESVRFYERSGFGETIDCNMWLRRRPPS